MAKETNQPSLKKEISNFFENNKMAVLFWILFVTLTSVSTLLKDANYLVNYLNQTFYKNEILYEKINSLTTDMDISKYIEALGGPTKMIKKSETIDYIFTNKMYFIKATTNRDGYVISFSITSRSKEFQPTLVSGINNSLYKVTLNKDTFEDLNKNANGISCYLNEWSQGYNYSEGRYLANAGNYQTVFYGINSLGYEETIKGFPEDNFGELLDDCSKIPEEFRKNIINTFYLDKEIYFNKESPFIGVNREEVGLAK